MLLSWAVHGFGRWKFGRAGAVVALLLGYWLWMMASALQAADSRGPGSWSSFTPRWFYRSSSA